MLCVLKIITLKLVHQNPWLTASTSLHNWQIKNKVNSLYSFNTETNQIDHKCLSYRGLHLYCSQRKELKNKVFFEGETYCSINVIPDMMKCQRLTERSTLPWCHVLPWSPPLWNTANHVLSTVFTSTVNVPIWGILDSNSLRLDMW